MRCVLQRRHIVYMDLIEQVYCRRAPAAAPAGTPVVLRRLGSAAPPATARAATLPALPGLGPPVPSEALISRVLERRRPRARSGAGAGPPARRAQPPPRRRAGRRTPRCSRAPTSPSTLGSARTCWRRCAPRDPRRRCPRCRAARAECSAARRCRSSRRGTRTQGR